ncbi:MAG: SUMF1/EgtB/PvdO family nonheme iron enzyme [Blastocatellia bacterium]
MTPEQTPPKVFISYSHDSQEHFDRILLLSDTLREWGIDCHIDQYELAPADWLRWMERRIREADFVLVVCTATYRRRFNGEEEPGKGLGVRHEGGVISAELYNRQTETAKFIPLVFSVTDSAHIPSVMQNTNRHTLNMEQLETDRGFENLYRQLTSQPRVIPKPLGKIRPLPPINRREEFDEEEVTAAPSPIVQPPRPKIVEPAKPKLIHQNFTEDLGNGIKLEMIAIPGGSFQMGSNDSDREKPIHRVTLSPFHIGKFQVTQAQWKAVMKANPSNFKGDNLPVETISWTDAFEFCLKLSEKTGNEYRLPTEAEWEYACLAGSTGKYCFGDDKALLNDYAWYYENSGSKTHPVGEKKPNNWGLHDMHGNVWEWCQDWYDANYYAELGKQGETVNPQGPANGKYRVLRGGSWLNDLSDARAVVRLGDIPAARNYGFGFRVVVCRPPSS